MRQAIVTKYIGPTNFRGSRVKAYCQAGSITLDWDDGLNPDNNHNRAAKALAERYGWDGNWMAGATPDGKGNVYVCDKFEVAAFVVAAERGHDCCLYHAVGGDLKNSCGGDTV